MRALVEHNALYNGPLRVWATGPVFRHERPQKGRYRQFHQIGVEALGFAGADTDAELILMCARLWEDLGLEDVALEINSLGSPEERAQHRPPWEPVCTLTPLHPSSSHLTRAAACVCVCERR